MEGIEFTEVAERDAVIDCPECGERAIRYNLIRQSDQQKVATIIACGSCGLDQRETTDVGS